MNENKSINATLSSDNVVALARINNLDPEMLPANITTEINSLLYDYRTSLVLLYTRNKLTAKLNDANDKEIEQITREHKKELDITCLKVQRAFAKENNSSGVTAFFALIEYQCELNGVNIRTKDFFITGFEQFCEVEGYFNHLFKGKPLTYKYVLDEILKKYIYTDENGEELYSFDDDTVDYKERWAEADYIELKLYRDKVKEAYAYNKNDEIIDYIYLGKDMPTIAVYRKDLFVKTNFKWIRDEEKDGFILTKMLG